MQQENFTAEGEVEFFEPHKKFGFVVPYDVTLGKIHVGRACLRRSGLSHLTTKARVRCKVEEGPQGPRAVSVKLL